MHTTCSTTRVNKYGKTAQTHLQCVHCAIRKTLRHSILPSLSLRLTDYLFQLQIKC